MIDVIDTAICVSRCLDEMTMPSHDGTAVGSQAEDASSGQLPDRILYEQTTER